MSKRKEGEGRDRKRVSWKSLSRLYSLLVLRPNIFEPLRETGVFPEGVTRESLVACLQGHSALVSSETDIPRSEEVEKQLRLLWELLRECSGCFARLNERGKRGAGSRPVHHIIRAIEWWYLHHNKENLPGVRILDPYFTGPTHLKGSAHAEPGQV